MPGLPTGTVTFLFTDIKGSTRLLQQLGDRYADVLVTHHRLLSTAIQETHGQVVDTQGDAVFAAFPRARDALLAAIAAQRAVRAHPWPDGIALKVRIGLHTGEPLSGETGYVGMDVHRAARIAAAGHGGQILVSEVTHGLVATDLPEGVSLRDLGEHRLKDLAHPHRLFQVVAADLPAVFPPLRSLDVHPHNLPIQLTSFIGREREIAEVTRLLATRRLVTLTGSGGAGKTRLALRVGTDLLDRYPDGVWLVGLAPISDSTLVPKTVASALDVPEQPGRQLTETLANSLRTRHLLLLLDNCEHVLSACRDLADKLLRSCPNLRILATSREGLGVEGESTYRVPSLELPDLNRLPPLATLAECEAVRLFVERAALSQSSFTLTARTGPTVAQICHRLDGIPLAIEFAAARVKVLAVEQIAARLDDRFRLLTGGSRTTLAQHQTLRAVMDWSHALLSEKEQAVLRRLAMFAGGSTLDAAEAVCTGDGVEAPEILDLLTQLVDKSLVEVETKDEEARYWLLETVRQYGLDRLIESGEATAVQRRHLDWYLELAERAGPKLAGPEQEEWLERLETEHANMRAALAWSKTDEGRVEAWLRLAGALGWFWAINEHWNEGRRWLEEALTRSSEAQPSTLARIMTGAGRLADRQGDLERGGDLAEQSLALYQTLGDKEVAIRSTLSLGNVVLELGDPGRATALLEESVALARELDHKWLIGFALLQLADCVRAQGDYERAARLGTESITLCREVGDKWRVSVGLRAMGIVSLRQRDYGQAATFYAEGLKLCRGRRNRWVSYQCVEGLGCVASAQGHNGRAAVLFGAAEALRESLRSTREPDYQAEVDQYMKSTRTSLGETVFASAWAEGRAMTLEQAIEYALKVGEADAAVTRWPHLEK